MKKHLASKTFQVKHKLGTNPLDDLEQVVVVSLDATALWSIAPHPSLTKVLRLLEYELWIKSIIASTNSCHKRLEGQQTRMSRAFEWMRGI